MEGESWKTSYTEKIFHYSKFLLPLCMIALYFIYVISDFFSGGLEGVSFVISFLIQLSPLFLIVSVSVYIISFLAVRVEELNLTLISFYDWRPCRLRLTNSQLTSIFFHYLHRFQAFDRKKRGVRSARLITPLAESSAPARQANNYRIVNVGQAVGNILNYYR